MANSLNANEKVIGSVAVGSLIFGLAFGAVTGAPHVLTASAVGLGVLFGMTFSKRAVRVEALT